MMQLQKDLQRILKNHGRASFVYEESQHSKYTISWNWITGNWDLYDDIARNSVKSGNWRVVWKAFKEFSKFKENNYDA